MIIPFPDPWLESSKAPWNFPRFLRAHVVDPRQALDGLAEPEMAWGLHFFGGNFQGVRMNLTYGVWV